MLKWQLPSSKIFLENTFESYLAIINTNVKFMKNESILLKYGFNILILFWVLLFNKSLLFAQIAESSDFFNEQQKSIILISTYTANGDLRKLNGALNKGLNEGLSINKIKECLVHSYAYCGFPRSIRGLQTFMQVLEVRKKNGIKDWVGAEASHIYDDRSKFEKGKTVLEKLTGNPQDGPKAGYATFSPEIEIFLKEHLFADLFERDILSYAERELVTISVISAIGKAEPMLKSHFSICQNLGYSQNQLSHFVLIIRKPLGIKKSKAAKKVLEDIIN